MAGEAERDFAGNVANILMRKGAALGNAQAQRGAIWGNTLATLGDRIPREVQEAMRVRAEQRKQAQIQQVFQQAGGDVEKALPQIMQIDPELGQRFGEEVYKSKKLAYDFQSLQWEHDQKRLEMAMNVLGSAQNDSDWAVGVKALHDAGADVSQIPPQFSPEARDAVNLRMLDAKDRLAATKPKPPEDFTLTPGSKRFTASGEVVAEVPYQLTPDQAADNTRAQQQLAISQGQLDIARQREAREGKQAADRLAFDREKLKADQATGATGPKLTGAQQEDLATMATVEDLANEAEKLGDKIQWSGVGGMGAGSVSQFMARNLGRGTSEQQELRNKIGNIQGTIAKLRGGTSFTPNEQALLETYTPTINDGDKVIKAKLKSLREFVASKRKNTLKVAAGDYGPTKSPAGGADPLGIR